MASRLVAMEVGATALRLSSASPWIRIGFLFSHLRPMSTGKRSAEDLWRDFFTNMSQWCDHRPDKMNPRFPDFKHKQTGEALWVIDSRNPPWIQAELAAIPSGILQSSVFSWNLRLKRYAKSGQPGMVLEVFQQMQREGIRSEPRTFLPVLNACAALGALQEGKRVHTQIRQIGCESDPYVATCLVDMYARCGSEEDAWNVFNKMPEHDVVSWSTMIVGYVKAGQGLKAIALFRKMQQKGVEPNIVTFVGVLNACASLGELEEGRATHVLIIRRGWESDVIISTCLIDMYAKCGSIDDAWKQFNKMADRNVVTWSAMIAGYVKAGQGSKAIELFRRMQREGVEPNPVTFVAVLNACASVAALEEGRQVHELVICRGCEDNKFIASCLIDMYAKCGSIEDAQSVFNKIPTRDVIVWTTMIGGYALNGNTEESIALFNQMCAEGIKVNEQTLTCLLSACSHGGLVEEGLWYFKSMSACFNILPTKEHYSGMVDLLGRAGRLAEAEELAKSMPSETCISAWRSLLAACKLHGNIEIAERAAERCRELDPQSASGYVLLSNIYAAARNWDRSAAIVRERMIR